MNINKAIKFIFENLLVITLLSFMIMGCSSLRAGIYLSSIDKLNGDEILKNEDKVKLFLENIVLSPNKYSIKAYKRIGISSQIKQTKLMSHAFYVIIYLDNEYHTLSFYGTKMAFYSEGAWIMDGDSDLSSYKLYLEGNNKWDVKEITSPNGIDVEETAKNILLKIASNVTYYYKDHINNKLGMDNCNTALNETLVEK